jgi:hypothetical protein
MISVLHRFPWHMPQYITVEARKKLYETICTCFNELHRALDTGSGLDREVFGRGYSMALFQELAVAALSCPGFSEQQKASLAGNLTDWRTFDLSALRSLEGINVTLGGTGPLSANWPFLALSPKPSTSNELLKVC